MSDMEVVIVTYHEYQEALNVHPLLCDASFRDEVWHWRFIIAPKKVT